MSTSQGWRWRQRIGSFLGAVGRTPLLVAAAMAMLLTVLTAAPAAAQTINNPGFETGSKSGWLEGGQSNGVNTAAAHTGSYGQYNNGGWNAVFQNVSGFATNTAYSVKVWARLSSGASNNQSVYISQDGGTTKTRQWINSTSWTQYTFNFTTGTNTSVQIGNEEANGSSTVAYVDDWTVTTGGSPPPAPTNLQATAGDAQVSLSWTASTGATSYNVKRSTTSGSGYANVATGIATTSYTNTGLTNGTTYYYVVSAVNANGESGNSSQAQATPVASNPTSLFSNAGFENNLTSWTNTGNSAITTDASSGTKAVVTGTGSGGVEQVISYTSGNSLNINVKAKVSGTISGWCGIGIDFLDSTGTEISETTFNVTATTYTAWAVSSQAVPAGTAQLRFWTWKPGTTGSLYVDDVVVTQVSGTVPAAPTNLQATAGNAQASLTWTASTGATSYNVKRSTTSGSGYANVATGITTTSYTNTGLTNGTTYYYVVSAVNAAGESANSSQASATPFSGGTGTGLKGDYYNSVDLSGSVVLSRTDSTVNFDWASGSPGTGVNADNFSARWTGQVQATTTGNYTFTTTSDDGVRLWVNGSQVINNWTDHGATNDTSAAISLTAGTKYNITMEYYERGGGAVAKLLWTPPGGSLVVIPASQLYPTTPPSGTTISIDRNTKYQTMEGFGFFGPRGAWWDSSDPAYFYSTPWIQQMFGDLGATMWRNELYPHIPVTANNGGQDAWWDKQKPTAQAIANYCSTNRIPLKILLTVWSPPAAYKCTLTNETFNIGVHPADTKGGNVLDPNQVNNFRDWLVSGLQMYKDAGLNVYGLSFQNEPYFWEPYNSCFYYQDRADHYDYHTFSRTINPAIRAFTNANGTHPLTFGSENMLDMEGKLDSYQWFYHRYIKDDATALANLDRFALHGYTDGIASQDPASALDCWKRHYETYAQPTGKPTWQTEISGFDPNTWLDNGSQHGSFSLGLSIQMALLYGKCSAWVWWSGTGGSAPDTYCLTGYNLNVGKTYYASKQFYRFIRPGSRMVATNNTDPDLPITAFENTTLNNFVVVLCNQSGSSKTVNLTGSSVPTSFTGFRTNATDNCANIGTVSASSVTIPANSILTLVNGSYTE